MSRSILPRVLFAPPHRQGSESTQQPPPPPKQRSGTSRKWITKTERSAVLLSILLSVTGPAGLSFADPGPSENHDRRGEYTVSTSAKGVGYHVRVPDSYSNENPAGILVYLCGTGSSADNSNFRHSLPFIEEHNLIGIHMRFEDGRPSIDADRKARATMEAVAQVQADYRTVNRGVIGGFSEGAFLLGTLLEDHRGKKAADRDWPFIHCNILSGNWNSRFRLPSTSHMSWFVANGNPKLKGGGDNMFPLMTPAFASLLAAHNPEAFYSLTVEKGHSPYRSDAVISARTFHRNDVLLAPFLSETGWDERLGPVVEQANERRFADALQSLGPIERSGTDEQKQQAAQLKNAMKDRVEAMVTLASELIESDPALANRYLPAVIDQLQGLPHQQILEEAFAAARNDAAFREQVELYEEFQQSFPQLFDCRWGAPRYGSLNAKHRPLLEKCVQRSRSESTLGLMASEFLNFPTE